MARARVVVETVETAVAEAGDLVIAIREGALDPRAIEPLGPALEAGAADGGGGDGRDITLFKSVGAAFEDLAVAAAAVGATGA